MGVSTHSWSRSVGTTYVALPSTYAATGRPRLPALTYAEEKPPTTVWPSPRRQTFRAQTTYTASGTTTPRTVAASWRDSTWETSVPGHQRQDESGAGDEERQPRQHLGSRQVDDAQLGQQRSDRNDGTDRREPLEDCAQGQSRCDLPGRSSIRWRAILAQCSVSGSTSITLTRLPATSDSIAQTKCGRSIRFIVEQ